MKIFTNFLSKQDYKQFKIYSIAAMWMGDLFTIFYLVTEVKKNNFVESYIKTILKMKGFEFEEMDPNLLDEFRLIVMSTLCVFILGIMVINNVNYYFFYKDKKWAMNYIRFLSYTSLFLTFIVLFQGIAQLSFTQLLNTFSIPLYLYVILGMEHFKKSKNEELQNEHPVDLPKDQ